MYEDPFTSKIDRDQHVDDKMLATQHQLETVDKRMRELMDQLRSTNGSARGLIEQELDDAICRNSKLVQKLKQLPLEKKAPFP